MLWANKRLILPFTLLFSRRPSAPYGAMRTAFEDFTCNYTDANGVARSVNFQKGDQIFTALHAMQNCESQTGSGDYFEYLFLT